MILSDSQIRTKMANKEIVINPMPSDRAIQPCSIDIHLSKYVALFKDTQGIIYPWKSTEMDFMQIDDIWYLNPGEIFLGSTEEYFEISRRVCARVDGLSSLGRIFLAVHCTAGFIDPGFNGNITLEIKNNNLWPIAIKPGMRIAQIVFEDINGIVQRPYGSIDLKSKYQNSIGAVAPKGECSE